MASLAGDLDNNGKVTRHDGFLYSLWLEGAAISDISPLTEEEFLSRADFNGDGVINVLDTVLFGQVTEFDPWAWDKNKNCYIDADENLDAVDAYIAGWITEAQRKVISDLYTNHTVNPACGAPLGFLPSSGHIAHVPVSNPTASEWTYTAELYLVKDGNKYTSSGIISFTLPAGASDTIDFPITMPAEGTYKVYIDVYVAGELIAAYQATEDVAVIGVGEFTYSNLFCEAIRWPGADKYDNWPHVEIDIQNTGSIVATRTIAVWLRSSFASEDYRREIHAKACGFGNCPYCKDPSPFELTLNPGETYHYCFCNYQFYPPDNNPLWMQDDKGWVSEKCYA